jgi:hypothetical protein
MNRINTLQQRAGRIQDPLRRKLINNNMAWIADAVDCIRCRYRKTYEGDKKSIIVEKTDVINAVFPPMVDVPVRKIKKDKDTDQWQLTSLINMFEQGEQEKFYKVQVPYNFDINVGDMLFRIFLDDNQSSNVVIPLEVTELTGTFGEGQMIMQSFQATIPTEAIPAEIVQVMMQMNERRTKVNY